MKTSILLGAMFIAHSINPEVFEAGIDSTILAIPLGIFMGVIIVSDIITAFEEMCK